MSEPPGLPDEDDLWIQDALGTLRDLPRVLLHQIFGDSSYSEKIRQVVRNTLHDLYASDFDRDQ